ncbi:MAG TPA: peptidoglycan-binding protein, partial [Pseudomonadota bacterium]|nr:peptidoglycan-binding protein [Pseudomonadota bacterium]
MWMQLGASGAQVQSWQQFLVEQQLLQAAALADGQGNFDAATADATMAYQRSHGLTVDGIVGEQTLNQARKDGYGGVVAGPRYTLLYGLRSAATDDWEHPAALVYAPPQLDPGELAVIVYLHGLGNHIENVVREAPLSADQPVADLLGQLDRAGCGALLLVPELRYDGRTSDPGRFANSGALRLLLAEVLEKLPPPLSGLRVEDVRRLLLISHSGGYQAAAALAQRGGVRVDELYLLDSLYGQEAAFSALLDETLAELAAAGSGPRQWATRRLINLYTRGGGTAELSRAQARRAAAEAERLQLAPGLVQTPDASAELLGPAELPDGSAVLIQRVA